MKKILNSFLFVFILLLAIVFVGCKTNEEGNKGDDPDPEPVHVHTYTSYFHKEKCTECGATGTKESERLYDDVVVYTYSEADYNKFLADYDALVAEIGKAGAYDPAKDVFVKDSEAYKAEAKFEEDFYDVFDEDCNIIVEQYQYATIREDMDTKSKQAEEDMDLISDYYNEVIEKYYGLYQPIYDSSFREYFFSEEDGWTEEDIQKALYDSATYSNPEYVKIKNENDSLEQQLDNISDMDSSEVLDIYEKFFANNKRLAEIEGNENYAIQAYKYVYGREYTPSDILAKLDKFTTLGVTFAEWYNDMPKISLNKDERKIAEALIKRSPLENSQANDLVFNFIKTMKHEKGDYKIDFEEELEHLFKTGAFFQGDYLGAYSWVIGRDELPIMYFGPGSYSSSFTFIHEFGHHNNSVLNGQNDFEVDSMDLNETHSQGDEMMLLNYLMEQNVSDDCKRYVANEELVGFLQIIVLAAAVDVFEQAIYTNHYTLANATAIMEDGQITKDEYDLLFQGILVSFGCGDLFNTNYWKHVCLRSPCYYISYSISALESLQIYFEYLENGYEATKAKYFKLYDYVTLEREEMTYKDVLEYVGISTYEDDELYDDAINYMKNN